MVEGRVEVARPGIPGARPAPAVRQARPAPRCQMSMLWRAAAGRDGRRRPARMRAVGQGSAARGMRKYEARVGRAQRPQSAAASRCRRRWRSWCDREHRVREAVADAGVAAARARSCGVSSCDAEQVGPVGGRPGRPAPPGRRCRGGCWPRGRAASRRPAALGVAAADRARQDRGREDEQVASAPSSRRRPVARGRRATPGDEQRGDAT